MSKLPINFTAVEELVNSNRTLVFNALDYVLNMQKQKHVMSFYSKPGLGLMFNIQQYAKEHNLFCAAIDLSDNKLSDAIRCDGTTGRFFVATDAKWVQEINEKGGILVFESFDRAELDDRHLVTNMIYNTKFGRETPFTDNVQIIITYRKADMVDRATLDRTMQFGMK